MGSETIRNGKGHRAARRKAAALKRRVATEGLVCTWCGEGFDLTLHHNDPMAYTADHPVALGNGGHLVAQTLAPQHRRCGALKGDQADVEIWEAT